MTLDEREEVRAAGRAILLLSDEIERLHIDLWHAVDRGSRVEEPDTATHASQPPDPVPAEDPPALGVTLRERLAMFRPSKATDR